ncbi:PDZK1-interacting protein 1 isoform X1 [Pungitius pungitius]|uniref:PDZK1-interacting protein 1 isoform X1 n=1 Tax=Pungitius pungitius TaxID=134920 RepID=UPI002E1530B5
MGKLYAAMSCLLLSVAAVTAQGAQTKMEERVLPQWLTGIIAVSGFLFLAFVGFVVKKAWCEEPRSRKKVTMELVRENESVNKNIYESSPGMVRVNTVVEVVGETENTYESTLDMVRSKDNRNAYDNLVIDDTEDKVTSM